MSQHLAQEELQETIEQLPFSALPTAPQVHTPELRYRAWLATQSQHGREEQLQGMTQMGQYAARASQAVAVGNKRIQTFAPFRYKYSALQTITPKQRLVLSLIGVVWLIALIFAWKITLAGTIAAVTIGYLSHLVLDVTLALAALRKPSEEQIDDGLVETLHDADWPVYTILCPLYKEARVVPQFVQAMKALDYPPDKLQILFLTETDDI